MHPQTPQLDTAFDQFVDLFTAALSKPQLAHFRVYRIGLILYIGVHWLSRLHEHVGHDKDYPAFVRFISEALWKEETVETVWLGYLNHHARRVLKSLARKANGKPVPVYLIIDDTLNPKRGKRMAWVGQHRSSANGKPTTGHWSVPY